MRAIDPKEVEVKCSSCKSTFAITAADCFKRFEVCGMINSGTFDREEVVYARCPQCQHRVPVTGKIASVAVTGDDPLCKCKGGSCRCED